MSVRPWRASANAICSTVCLNSWSVVRVVLMSTFAVLTKARPLSARPFNAVGLVSWYAYSLPPNWLSSASAIWLMPAVSASGAGFSCAGTSTLLAAAHLSRDCCAAVLASVATTSLSACAAGKLGTAAGSASGIEMKLSSTLGASVVGASRNLSRPNLCSVSRLGTGKTGASIVGSTRPGICCISATGPSVGSIRPMLRTGTGPRMSLASPASCSAAAIASEAVAACWSDAVAVCLSCSKRAARASLAAVLAAVACSKLISVWS